MESGSQATLAIFTAESGDALWNIFTKAVPSCASAAQGKTLPCLQQAPLADLLNAAALAGSQNPGEFAFIPVIDGQGGVIPDLPSTLLASGAFSKIPFIAGTNLDDGTVFTSKTVNSDASIFTFLAKIGATAGNENDSIAGIQSMFLNLVVSAYPDDPAAGSPYNTGSNTFGLSPFFKKAASIVGDASFQATRRAWISAAATKGVTTYGYLFTEPAATSAATGGEPLQNLTYSLLIHFVVAHGSEINYVYGAPLLQGPSPAATLSTQMMDYWLSFAVAGNPNDGRGSTSKSFVK